MSNAFVVRAYASVASFPTLGEDGEMAVSLSPKSLYTFNTGTNTWQLLGAVGGAVTSVTDDGNLVVVVDNTVPTAPVITFAGVNVDGVTITGDGTTGSPLVAAASPITPAALTRVDDTNVTLTLGGTPATALLQATSITAGWTGTLAPGRGGTGTGTTFTQGSVIFAGALGVYSEDNANFFWDDTNNSLVLVNAGTATNPTIAIGGIDTGFFQSAANTVALSISGTVRYNANSTRISSSTTAGFYIGRAAGTAGAPTFSFNGTTNTGMWLNGTSLGFSVAGINNFNITTGNILQLNNPANTFAYSITPAAIASNRQLNLPLTTATDTLATLGLAQTFTAQQTFTGNMSASTGNQAFASLMVGNSTPAAVVYRQTNAGADIATQFITTLNTPATPGSLLFGLDASNQLSFSAGNGTRFIQRAGIQILSLTNTAGSETGDLAFFTQSGGTSIREKFRISSGGNLLLYNPALTFQYTITPGAIAANRILNLPVTTGTDTLVVRGLAQTFSQNMTFTGDILKTGIASTGGNGFAATKVTAGVNTTNGPTYKLTNAGGAVAPFLAVWSSQSTAGILSVIADGTNGLMLGHGNGTTQIAGAALQLTNLTNTAGSEASDLIILTQNAGTAMSQKMRISKVGNIVAGAEAALATNATDGFLYIPTCAGTPTGVPTAYTGKVAMVFDTTNNKFYIYDGGWLGGTTPGAFT